MTADALPGALLRRRRRRRRAGRAGRLGVRRVRGPAHADGRRRRRRRSGRHQLADRELPRVPDRHLGPGPGDAGLDPGPEVRRRHHQPVRRHVAATTSPGTSSPRLSDGTQVAGRAARRRHRRPLPQAAGRPGSSATRWPASTTRRPSWRPGCAPARRSSSSAAATRPGRRRCSSPRRRSSVCVVVRRPLSATMSNYLVDRISQPSPRAGARRHDGHRARTATRRCNASPSAAPDAPVDVDCTALFSFIGAEPNSALARRRRRRRARLRAHRPRPGRTTRSATRGARWGADRCPTRRAGPACSPSATSARARPSASPPPSARGQRRSARSTSTSPSPSTPDRTG